jgi:hypothetical protein
MASRKNAMLTTEDRRWLTGEKSYEGEHAKQQRYQRRRDIRERVWNSVLDFSILFEHLADDEREKIFDSLADADGTSRDDRGAFADGVRDALAFFLYNVGVTALMRGAPSAASDGAVAERFVADAVSRAGRKDGFLVEAVALDVDSTPASVSDLLAALESGADLTAEELRFLVESGTVDLTEFQECIRDQLFGETDR